MTHYSVLNAGAPEAWSTGQFPHPAFEKPVRGKQFLAERLGLTGMEISLNSLPSNYSVPFLHSHREHEELYLFVAGEGEMLIDGDIVAVRSGTAVRVAPPAKRAWRNTGAEPLVYLVIQAKADTLTSNTIKDGRVAKEPPDWAHAAIVS